MLNKLAPLVVPNLPLAHPKQMLHSGPQLFSKPFSITELKFTLKNSRSTCPGKGVLTYKMLFHLPNNAKIIL